MSTIFRKSPLPRYYQLKEIMREKFVLVNGNLVISFHPNAN